MPLQLPLKVPQDAQYTPAARGATQRTAWATVGVNLGLGLSLLAMPAVAAALNCGGVIAPGLAYPDPAGKWHGLEIDLCRRIAANTGTQALFTPVLQDTDVPPAGGDRSVVFLPASDIPAGYAAGPVIYNDHQALMVPAGSKVRSAADLANAYICVEPGSPEDFNLVAYFHRHHIALRKFVFQETDEMRDAYLARRCDAITARISLLSGLRANADGDGQGDVILPDNLGDNPLRAATPAGLHGWAQIVRRIVLEGKHVGQ